MSQTIVILEGPDGCGKTEISRALSKEIGIPYFKVDSERDNWEHDTFKHALWFDYTLPQLLRVTKSSFIADRGYPSEWVYSRVFGRATNDLMLEKTDRGFAELGTTIIVPVRRDYSKARYDDLVPNDKLEALHDTYMQFISWTACNVIKIYVDDFGNDLKQQIPALLEVWPRGPFRTCTTLQK